MRDLIRSWSLGALALMWPVLVGELSSQQWHQSPTNGRVYTLSPPMTWHDAEAYAVGLGGHLATVRNQLEQDWLLSTFGINQLWIGLNDEAVEGTFVWSSGEPVTFTKWASGEPDGRAAEDFVRSGGGGWIDSTAGLTVRGIVEVADLAAYTTFGTACSGSVGVPVLTAAPGKLPRIGNTFTAQLSNVPGDDAFLVFGLSKTDWSGISLPLGLSRFGLADCSLFVSIDEVVMASASMGVARHRFTIPNDSHLLGLRFYNQGIIFDPGAVPFLGGAVLTNAAEGIVGAARSPLPVEIEGESTGRPLPHVRATDQKRPNIVMFLVDDMGWMDSGVYGSGYYETPHIDRFAQRGMRFVNAYAANPLCSPTRASILTGKYPARLRFTGPVGHLSPLPPGTPLLPAQAPPNRPVIVPESRRYLDPDEYTLSEALRDAGYATGHFGKWHLGLTEPHWPEQFGYEVAFHGHPDTGPPSPNGYFSPYSFARGTVTPGSPDEYMTDRLTDEALRFIEAERDRPFFAAVWHYGVHGPWDHKEEYTRIYAQRSDPRGKQHNPVMASMLRSIDDSLGRIVAKLEELGLTQNTIVLFTSDNGGNVHNNLEGDPPNRGVGPGHPRWRWLSSYRTWAGFLPPTNNEPLRHGKGTLFEGGVRVPLIAVWPGHIRPNTITNTLASSIDFYPTLLDLVEVEPEPTQQLDGISLAPVLQGRHRRIERPILNFYPHTGLAKPGVSVRQGNWKLIRWFETGPGYPDEHELYNLADDLSETKNKASERPELVESLNRLIDQFLIDTDAIVPVPNPNYRPG